MVSPDRFQLYSTPSPVSPLIYPGPSPIYAALSSFAVHLCLEAPRVSFSADRLRPSDLARVWAYVVEAT